MRVTCKEKGARRAPSPKWENDLVLILALLAVLLLVGVCLLLTQKQGDMVRVSVNGQLYGVYPLHEDAMVDIVTEAGYNRLVIKDGQAYVEATDCPDAICASHRPINGTRESITCLPHGVVITIECDGQDGPDVVV